MTEKEYTELYKYSLKAAYRYVGYQEAAYDIAQNAILSFLSSKNQIQSPLSWIRVVLRREAAKFFDQQKNQISISKRLPKEPIEVTKDDLDTDRIMALNTLTIKRYLSKTDFEIYAKLKKVKFSVQAYANREDISYNTAKNHRQRIKRNILSSLLLEDGWRTGNQILNHTQYYNIQRFVNTLVESARNPKHHELKHYTSKIDSDSVRDLLSDVQEVIEWSVFFTDDHLYRIILVCYDAERRPLCPLVFVKFDDLNRIKIIRLKKTELECLGTGSLKVADRFLEKGALPAKDIVDNVMLPLILDKKN